MALYLRPGPYGGPFLLEWRRYFGLSLYFDLLGVWLIAFPFLLVWLVLRARHALRVAVVAFFVLCFTAFTVSSRADWLAVVIGVALGLFFGLVFAFGEKWNDALER